MPYIKQSKRQIQQIATLTPETAGELNYIFSRLALNYLNAQGMSYQHWNDICGALESCKLELYRRFIGKYEDLKIKENGDIV